MDKFFTEKDMNIYEQLCIEFPRDMNKITCSTWKKTKAMYYRTMMSPKTADWLSDIYNSVNLIMELKYILVVLCSMHDPCHEKDIESNSSS